MLQHGDQAKLRVANRSGEELPVTPVVYLYLVEFLHYVMTFGALDRASAAYQEKITLPRNSASVSEIGCVSALVAEDPIYHLRVEPREEGRDIYPIYFCP